MRKKELIKALSKIEEGIADVKNILLAEEDTQAVAEKKVAEKEVVTPPVTEESPNGYTKEQLDAMKYNDLKKLGAKLGVKCTGTRDEITAKILSAPVVAEVEEVVEEEKVVPITKNKAPKKEEEPVEEDEIEEQYLDLAREALEDNEIEDVIEVLAEAGIKLSAKDKKKEDVVMRKLAEAFQNGMIDTEDEEEDEPVEEEQEEKDSDDLDFSEDSYFDQYDPEGYNDPSIMTKKRAKAVKTLVAKIINDFEEEVITTESIEEELGDIVTDDDVELLGEDYSDEELVAFYIEMKKRFIDNDGTTCDPSDPYELGEANFCCGHELEYDKKGKKYTCTICGEEYEAE